DIACAAVVIADGPYFEPRFAHSALLARALESPASPYRRLAAYKHDRHDGHTTLYVRKDLAGRPLPLDRIRQVNFPGKSPVSAEKGK
ncbi:MAG: hypothetical protein LBS70_10865, partial [Candidatus Accumulibacter sp.]|nr:hypothetical protein [Accumulibacter sp.]